MNQPGLDHPDVDYLARRISLHPALQRVISVDDPWFTLPCLHEVLVRLPAGQRPSLVTYNTVNPICDHQSQSGVTSP